MEFKKVLGQVLRDVRLQAGLTRTECGEIVHLANLSKVENGQALLRIDTLAALCEQLGVTLSDVLMVVEARLSGHSIEDQIALSNERLGDLLRAGRFEPIAQADALRGIRGRKADTTREAVMRLQSEGLRKDEIARKLGVGLRTVQRYWAKGI